MEAINQLIGLFAGIPCLASVGMNVRIMAEHTYSSSGLSK